MPTVNVSPFGPKPQIVLGSGLPAVGGLLFFYVAGSVNTKQNTYTDSTGATPNTNPLVLNAIGEPTTEIWFAAGQAYKVVYAPANDTDPPTSPIWSIDNLRGINDTTVSASEWVAGPTPTYIGATQFSLVGDQTSIFTVGRRVKTVNTGGTIYGVITASVYGVVTTVTVLNDSGALDAGLSGVSYGLISATNTSAPFVGQTYTNSLAGDVALNNTGNYFTGPTVGQGTIGTWYASGAVTVDDTAGAANIPVKLWDGTTVIASGFAFVTAANEPVTVSLSGRIASPAGNIRMSCKDSSSTNGVIRFNSTGNSKDSTLTVTRIG